MTTIRIKRRFAVWQEDAVQTDLPEGIEATDKAAVDAWARDNYDRLFLTAKGELIDDDTEAVVEWEDEWVANLDDHDDEYTTELITEYK
jgi:hypothetical protein